MIEPKPFITRNEYFQMEESTRPTHGHCEKHGKFEIKTDDTLPIQILMATCPSCTEEYKNWKNSQEEIEKKKREEEYQVMMYEKRLRKFGVSPRHFYKTFENYEAKTKEQKLALKTCQYVSQKVTEGVSKNIIMVGSVGTGKTHLASAMCHYLADFGDKYNVKMATVTEIIRYYRSSYSNDNDLTEDKVISTLTNKDLLIIDELGTSKGDDKELNILFEVINNRYEYKRPTVLISNLDIDAVKELLGQRIIDRLKEDGCRVLGMAWESHRETNKDEF